MAVFPQRPGAPVRAVLAAEARGGRRRRPDLPALCGDRASRRGARPGPGPGGRVRAGSRRERRARLSGPHARRPRRPSPASHALDGGSGAARRRHRGLRGLVRARRAHGEPDVELRERVLGWDRHAGARVDRSGTSARPSLRRARRRARSGARIRADVARRPGSERPVLGHARRLPRRPSTIRGTSRTGSSRGSRGAGRARDDGDGVRRRPAGAHALPLARPRRPRRRGDGDRARRPRRGLHRPGVGTTETHPPGVPAGARGLHGPGGLPGTRRTRSGGEGTTASGSRRS